LEIDFKNNPSSSDGRKVIRRLFSNGYKGRKLLPLRPTPLDPCRCCTATRPRPHPLRCDFDRSSMTTALLKTDTTAFPLNRTLLHGYPMHTIARLQPARWPDQSEQLYFIRVILTASLYPG